MKRLLVSVALIFLSLNINAEISQTGITNLKQLDSNGINELISGNQLTGFISDGPFQGPVVQTFFKNGKYETIFEGKIYKGVWKVENKKYCSKNNTANNFNCVYWYTGNKDGGTYAYIIAQGKIFHQYHELKSVVQAKAEEKKKAEESKKIADAKKVEEKKKAEESKKIADAKKAEEKQLLDESSSSAVNEEYPSDAREQFVLGFKYYHGDGVEKDFRKAAELWELSSEQGYAEAQYVLGDAYYYGEGVKKDYAIAYMWTSMSLTEFYVINGQPTGVDNSHRKKEYMLANNRIAEIRSELLSMHANIPSSSDIIKGRALASACWRQKFKNCESNHLTYSVESENKAKESGLPLCPEDDPNLMYQLKWDNCFGIGESQYGKYEGEFVNGDLHGNATFYYHNGDVYIGEYFQGRIEGQGTYLMVNGDKYEGMFRDYAFDGVGKYTYSDGRVEEGIWENSQLVESKKTNKSIPVEKEYVAIEIASIRKQPFDDSEVVKKIPKGTTVFVISKTETNDWYLIKEIMEDWGGDDIGEILGYSSADSFLSADEITSGNDNSNAKVYSDSPGNLLINAYINYVVIKNMHSMREGYAVVYVNDSQMKKVKNQVIEIEKILVNEFSLDEDLLWDTAMKKYDKDYSVIDLLESTGIYTEDGNRVAMIALLSIDTIADEVIGSSSKKDF